MESKLIVIFSSLLFACVGQDLTEVDLCFPTFTKFEGIHSLKGVKMNGTTLERCTKECQENSRCLAFDFDPTDAVPCWMHVDPSFKVADNIYDNYRKSQYRINRKCQTRRVAVTDCPSSWEIVTNSRSSLAPLESLNFSYTSCLTYCRFHASCQGIVYDPSGWPPCHVFDKKEFSSGARVERRQHSVINKLNRDACSVEKKSLGRCAGRSFPPASRWCPVGKTLVVTGKYYRIHQFCCPGSSDLEIPPLDSRDLLSLDIDYVDPAYGAVVADCLSSPSCRLQAPSFTANFPVYSYCPSLHDFYYVAVEYKCLDPSAVPDVSKCPNPVMTQSPSAALVLGAFGFVLGLTCFLIIISLVAYVCFLKRWKEQRAETSRESNFNPFFAVHGSSARIIKIDDGRASVASSKLEA